MKRSLFNTNQFLKILFPNKAIDKICWMLGFGIFVTSIICYVLALTSFISISQINNAKSYQLLLRSGLIFLFLAIFGGIHASIWIILAFHNKKRLMVKKRTLKIFCLSSLNFLGYFTIDYLIEKFLETEETFASVLLTHQHVLKKSNKIWQAFLIFFAMISIITFPPVIFLTCWIISESHYVYFEESTIRDRIALGMESLFCLFPPFSLINLRVISKNKLFIAWLSENATDNPKDNFVIKNYWNKSANFLIWFVYWIAIFLLLVWFSSTMVFLTSHLEGFKWKNFFILFMWPITSLFLLGFTIYKKYLWEMDQKMPLWILVFEILTLNLLLMAVSLIFVYKNNQFAKNKNDQWKAELNQNFFWLILINTLLAYLLISSAFYLSPLGQSYLIINILMLSGVVTFIHLVLNIWKMTNYKTYFNNLLWWVLIDFATINFLGLVFNTISKRKKNKLQATLAWI